MIYQNSFFSTKALITASKIGFAISMFAVSAGCNYSGSDYGMKNEERSVIVKRAKQEHEKLEYNKEEGLSRVEKINKLAAKLSSPETYKFLPKGKIKNAVVIIGKTGSGKSTLINLMAGRQLKGIKEGGFNRIDVDEPVSSICHGGNSGTEEPKYFYYDKDKYDAYVDCPGFFDNRGDEHEIINAFYIRKVMENAVKSKLILLCENSLTASRANELFEIADGLSDMVGGNVESLFGKVLLGITKVSADDDYEDVVERLKTLIKSFSGEKQLIASFFEQIIKNEHLFLFHYKKGPIASESITSEIKDKIKKIDCFRSNTYPVVSNKSKLYVRDCLAIARNEYLEKFCLFSESRRQ